MLFYIKIADKICECLYFQQGRGSRYEMEENAGGNAFSASVGNVGTFMICSTCIYYSMDACYYRTVWHLAGISDCCWNHRSCFQCCSVLWSVKFLHYEQIRILFLTYKWDNRSVLVNPTFFLFFFMFLLDPGMRGSCLVFWHKKFFSCCFFHWFQKWNFEILGLDKTLNVHDEKKVFKQNLDWSFSQRVWTICWCLLSVIFDKSLCFQMYWTKIFIGILNRLHIGAARAKQIVCCQ